jgi:hypothetical protein
MNEGKKEGITEAISEVSKYIFSTRIITIRGYGNVPHR